MKLKGKNKIIFLILVFFSISCKKDQPDKPMPLLAFNPRMITTLDLSKTDSVILEEYQQDKRIYSKWVKFKFKTKVDTAYTAFKQAKYDFHLKQDFIQKRDYQLIFIINNKKYKYFFKKIDYDTIKNGKNYFFVTKSFFLNGEFHSGSVYYLD